MASTYKVPIAGQLLTQVDQGELTLDSLVRLEPADLHPASATLTQLFDDPVVILSLRNLLKLMLLISDNSATDLVMRAAGGPEAVTRRMQALEVEGIRVSTDPRSTSLLIGSASRTCHRASSGAPTRSESCTRLPRRNGWSSGSRIGRRNTAPPHESIR